MKEVNENRRSGRQRKVIDYTKLDSLGDDDDEDFKNFSPPSKRQKQGPKENSEKKAKKVKDETANIKDAKRSNRTLDCNLHSAEQLVTSACNISSDVSSSKDVATTASNKGDNDGRSPRTPDNSLDFSDSVANNREAVAMKAPAVMSKKGLPVSKQDRESVKVPPKLPLATSTRINIPSTKTRLPNTGLRLGLSRKVPTKPLHSFVKAQQ